jgi:tRNA(fMet)-specific endonuclease VapC
MARYLLDTNIIIYAYNSVPAILDRLARYSLGDVAVSTLSYSELLAGATNTEEAERLALITANFDILSYDRLAAETYGQIMRALSYNRRRAFDRMIAAHALSRKMTLATNNAQDFEDIEGLNLERWSP